MSNIYDVKVKRGKSVPWKALFLNSYAVLSLNNIKLDYVDSSGETSVTYHLLTNDEFKRTMNAKYPTVAWPTWIRKIDGTWDDQEVDIDNVQKMMTLTTTVASAINNYLNDHKAAFWHVYNATVKTEYDPLVNYDRTEERSHSDGGTDTITHAGSETHTNTVDSNNPVTTTGYNTVMDTVSESETAKSVSTGTTTDTLTYNQRSDSNSHSSEGSESIRAFGNIGVTTSQQMAQAAIELGAKEAFVNWVVAQIVQDLFVFQ